MSILVYDLERDSATPHGVLTGDTLFVGDVGRPDLRAALGWSAAQLGDLLYDSLHGKLLALPDATLVYPAHGAGSLCGKAISRETVSTIGEQRRSNYAVQPMSKAAFVDLVTADQPDAPPYFTYDAVLELAARGAQLLDTRDPIEFAAAHLRAASTSASPASMRRGPARSCRATSRSSSARGRAPASLSPGPANVVE
jgi:glyoxylase-like metal-dependent hydrolase (beta-lactamase superfamily II)